MGVADRFHSSYWMTLYPEVKGRCAESSVLNHVASVPSLYVLWFS